ncbi:hypothetical protein GLA29479_3135 [Lysobacter antibioticus]|nr:hypothetical protein GLA29479_3135 [Lysobacter antibioticus]
MPSSLARDVLLAKCSKMLPRPRLPPSPALARLPPASQAATRLILHISEWMSPDWREERTRTCSVRLQKLCQPSHFYEI